MAVRRLAPLLFILAGLPLFSAETQDVPLCLRPADLTSHVWPQLPVDPDDASRDSFFEDEVWAKVGERTCLNCHSPGAHAEDSKFVLRDASLDSGLLRVNRASFEEMAGRKLDGKSRLLVKVSGGQKHGGGAAPK